MILFLLFCLGACVGSFLNVCIWRLPRGESVVEPPSHCPNCNTRLNALDLMPLVSQLWLRGRCRYCGTRFSWRYFGIELLTGCLFALIATQPGNIDGYQFFAPWIGDPYRLARDLIFVSTLVVVFFVDYDTRLIQLESVFLMGFAGVAYDFWQNWNANPLTDGKILAPVLPAPVPESILAMVVTAAGLWLVREAFSWLYKREALGFGDVILVAAIAANLGWNSTLITFFFLSIMLGATIGVTLQIPRAVRSFSWGKRRHQRYGGPRIALGLARKAFRKAMPFGPMLAMGALAALLYGARLNAAYLDLVEPPAATATIVPAPYLTRPMPLPTIAPFVSP